jgi:lipoprotein-anchoring transpeptidase ErfK/SrfK
VKGEANVLRRARSRGVSGVVGALFAVLLLAATACTGSGEATDDQGGGDREPGRTEPAAVEIAISPGDGATKVPTSGELRVTAEGGTLTRVTVADAEGREVPGELAGDGASWQPGEHLANAARYSVAAVGENAAGQETTRSSSFRTVAADATFTSSWNISDGARVGTGMVLSMTFDTPIENTAAVRDAIRITTEPEVAVRGHWFGTQRLDFRPEEYWEPGTEVEVRIRERGVEGADGVYGTAYENVRFAVGRSQVSTVDAEAMTMRVVRNGERVRTIPITTGAPGYETWNGKMVITEQLQETRMDGATVGYDGEYDIPDVPHAQRLTTSGTFIHGNYWAGEPTFGSANVSHGCIGLYDAQGAGDPSTPGAWFFEHSLVGDVVEVVNSHDAIVAPDNGLSGWNMAWNRWGAGQ